MLRVLNSPIFISDIAVLENCIKELDSFKSATQLLLKQKEELEAELGISEGEKIGIIAEVKQAFSIASNDNIFFLYKHCYYGIIYGIWCFLLFLSWY